MAHLLVHPRPKFYDTAGAVLALGKVYTYQAGTTTPLTTYTDKTEGATNANPVVLDAFGEADIWLGANAYKIVIKTAADVTLYTYDNVTQVNADAITTAKILNLAVTTAKINDLAVTTGKINDLGVTAGKIAADAVITAKINDLAVTTGKINDLAVTTGKIAANAVTAAKIDADFINDYSTVSPELTDYFIFGDTSDSNNVKKALVSTIPPNTEKRLMVYLKNQGAATATSLGFAAAPTLTATVTAVDDATSTWMRHTTGSSSGNASGVISTTYTQAQPRWLPEFMIKQRIGAASGNAMTRGFAGFFSGSPDAAGDIATQSATPALAMAAFVFENPVSGGSTRYVYRAVTSDGTSGGAHYTYTTCQLSGVDVEPTSVARVLRIVWISTSEVRFYIDGTLVATHTTTLPTSNQALGFGSRVVTTQAASNEIDWSRFEVRHV